MGCFSTQFAPIGFVVKELPKAALCSGELLCWVAPFWEISLRDLWFSDSAQIYAVYSFYSLMKKNDWWIITQCNLKWYLGMKSLFEMSKQNLSSISDNITQWNACRKLGYSPLVSCIWWAGSVLRAPHLLKCLLGRSESCKRWCEICKKKK